jgi:hypothetical protein
MRVVKHPLQSLPETGTAWPQDLQLIRNLRAAQPLQTRYERCWRLNWARQPSPIPPGRYLRFPLPDTGLVEGKLFLGTGQRDYETDSLTAQYSGRWRFFPSRPYFETGD